jgi:DNA-binding LytR/AlgR family response regulator
MAATVLAQRPRLIWIGLSVVPLAAGWGIALATQPRHALPQVIWIGTIALGGAVAGAGVLWWRASSYARIGWSALVELMLAVVTSAVLWTWIQYALNPFRMRPVVDAMLASRSTPWQVTAGLGLFIAIVIVARVFHDRGGRTEDQGVAASGGPPAPALKELTVRIGRRTLLINLEQVERIQACDDYVEVFTKGRRLLASYRLSDLATRLDTDCFVRIHRSHIVSVYHIAAVERADANRDTVRMKSGECIQASRRGSVALRDRLRRSS